MKKKKNLQKIAFTVLFLLLLIAPSVQAVFYWGNDLFFETQDTLFKPSYTPMLMDKVTVDNASNYIVFNSVNVTVNSANPVNITLVNASWDAFNVTYGNRIIEFIVTEATGTVQFNITDLRSYSGYDVYMNGSSIGQVTSNASGRITWSYSSWSGDKRFLVKRLSTSGAPSISANVWANTGFNVNFTGYINVTCTDDYSPNIDVNITVFGSKWEYFNESITNGGTTATYSFNLSNTSFTNYLYIKAIDIDGNINYYNTTLDVYAVNLSFVNERNGSLFNWNTAKTVGKMTGCELTIPGKQFYQDLYNNETLYLEYISTNNDVIRINTTYENVTDTVIRSFDISLIDSISTIGLVEKETQFYEQLIYSTSKKPICVKNVFSQCFVGAGYTEYAYGETYTFSVLTIDMLYYMYTYSNGTRVFLASIEGSRPAQINLDFLDYSNISFDFGIFEDQISIAKFDDDTFIIAYMNIDSDNKQVEIKIYDGVNQIFYHLETSNPNEFVIYFDISTLNLTGQTLKIEFVVEKNDGSVETITKYFNIQTGQVTSFPPQIIAVISIGIFIFSITFVSSKNVFGVFGIIGCIIALAVTAFTTQEWYITLIQAGEVICLIFMILIFKQEGGGVK